MRFQKDSDLLQFLSKVPLFASIPEPRLAEIGEECEEVFFPKGETVFLEGDPGDSMYLIKSGSVGVYGATGGGESFVASLHRGDFFGEMALLTGKPRTATIRVLLDAQLFKLTKTGFDDLLKRSPGVALYLSRLYAHRFAETNELTLNEPQPTFYSMIATHQGLGKGRFLYSLAYHLATEAWKRVLVVELQEKRFKERGGYGLEKAVCPNSDLLEVFPARFKGVMGKAWYRHECGFSVFVLPALKEGEYWEALEANLAVIMDLLREKSDYVFFNVPVSFRPVGERVVRLCDRALVLMNNQGPELPEVRKCVLRTVELMRGRRDYVRAGVSHLVGDKGIPRSDLAEELGLPETPAVWVPKDRGGAGEGIDTDKSFPVRGARALARELGGVRVGLVMEKLPSKFKARRWCWSGAM
ncbi:MAG: cyclic nucleotide-binding domain-containing protein [Desulfobacteraceae bacterium]